MKTIDLEKAQEVIKKYFLTSIGEHKYMVDAVDASADLCRALEEIAK